MELKRLFEQRSDEEEEASELGDAGSSYHGEGSFRLGALGVGTIADQGEDVRGYSVGRKRWSWVLYRRTNRYENKRHKGGNEEVDDARSRGGGGNNSTYRPRRRLEVRGGGRYR